MKFEFSYENLLKHKKSQEEIAHREYAAAQMKVEEANAELSMMYKAVDESRKRSRLLERVGGAQAPALVQIHEFISGQKVRIERQRERIRALVAEAEARQERLIEAAREFKTLEKLREKRWAEFKKAMKKRELKEVDDLVTMRFKREERE